MQRKPVNRPARTAWLMATAMLLLAGCDRAGQTPAEMPIETSSGVPAVTPVQTPIPGAPSPTPTASPPLSANETSTPENVATLVPESEKGETGARNVLLTWARALENGDYDKAYAQWGDINGSGGLTATAHADFWRKYRTITIAMPTGTMDAGAGSLFYEAPTVVTGTDRNGSPYRLEGVVGLRRVNDVDGATLAQLRWHIDRVDLKPA